MQKRREGNFLSLSPKIPQNHTADSAQHWWKTNWPSKTHIFPQHLRSQLSFLHNIPRNDGTTNNQKTPIPLAQTSTKCSTTTSHVRLAHTTCHGQPIRLSRATLLYANTNEARHNIYTLFIRVVITWLRLIKQRSKSNHCWTNMSHIYTNDIKNMHYCRRLILYIPL